MSILGRLKMNADSLLSSFASARMQAMAEKRKFMGRFKKAGAQDSLFGFGVIQKPNFSKQNTPNLEAEANEAAVPTDGTFGLVG